VSDADFPNVWDVASYGGGLVAVVPRGLHHSTAWYSADGDQWLKAEVPEDFHVTYVSSTTNGLFAWFDHRVFTSADGQHWFDGAKAPDPTGARLCFVQDIGGQTVLGATSGSTPLAWVLEGSRWTSRPSLAAGENSDGWCGRHQTAMTSALGPPGKVSIRPLEDFFDTVFLEAEEGSP